MPSSCLSWIRTLPLYWTSLFHSLGYILFFCHTKGEMYYNMPWKTQLFQRHCWKQLLVLRNFVSKLLQGPFNIPSGLHHRGTGFCFISTARNPSGHLGTASDRSQSLLLANYTFILDETSQVSQY